VRKIMSMPLALVCAAACLCGCSRLESGERAGEKLAVDVIDRFADARVDDGGFPEKYKDLLSYEKIYRDPWGFDSPRLVKVGFETDRKKMRQDVRRALYLGAYHSSPCGVSLPLAKETVRGARLEFSVAGLKLDRKAGCLLEIAVADGKRRDVVFSSAARDCGIRERQWALYSLRIPEGPWDSPRLEISLRSDATTAQHVFVANPRVFARDIRGDGRPNVIFISVDSLRADAVESIVKKYNLTPHMDKLAADGIACTNHFVVSNWTRPSTIAMLSSVYASSAGVNLYYPPVSGEEKNFFYRESGVIPLARLLKKSGYVSCSIGNNAFIIDYTGIGVDLGFDELSEYETQWEDTIDITDEAACWLERNRGRRFCLFINYNAPHNAYIPPPRYLEPLKKRLKNIHPWFRAYLGEVAYTDDYIGRLISALKNLGLYKNTIIVLTADHGEIFSKSHEMSPYTDVKAIFSHGQTQLDEELRVPLIVKPAFGAGPVNVRVDAQVRSIDILPTILELMKIDMPDAYRGKSILPIIEGSERDERVVYSEGRMMYSVRAGGYKYAERFCGFGIRPFHWGGDTVPEYRELYDLKNDPEEEHNLAAVSPALADAMRAKLRDVRFKQPDNRLVAMEDGVQGAMRVTDGFFYDAVADGASGLARISRKEYAFELKKGDTVTFQTIPADARVRVTLKNGARLLAGRYCLPLVVPEGGASGRYLLDPSRGEMWGRPAKELAALVNSGVLYWNEPLVRGLRGVKKEQYLSKDINNLLQKWGYIQGKEKKAASDARQTP